MKVISFFLPLLRASSTTTMAFSLMRNMNGFTRSQNLLSVATDQSIDILTVIDAVRPSESKIQKRLKNDQILPFSKESNSESDLAQAIATLNLLTPTGRDIVQKLEKTVSTVQTYSSSSTVSANVLQQNEFHQSLKEAKLADLKFGVCSTESSMAWNRVDELYKSSKSNRNRIDDQVLTDVLNACATLNRALGDFERMIS